MSSDGKFSLLLSFEKENKQLFYSKGSGVNVPTPSSISEYPIAILPLSITFVPKVSFVESDIFTKWDDVVQIELRPVQTIYSGIDLGFANLIHQMTLPFTKVFSTRIAFNKETDELMELSFMSVWLS